MSVAAQPVGGVGLETLRLAFESHFARALPPVATVPRRLHAALRYSALSPGKRLRPLLVLTACRAAGGRWRDALPAAAAVECVHAFSLVHDDLPCMDDDDLRRGRATTHKKFGEALGVLAGDALLALAFERIAALSPRVPEASTLEASRVLARATGSLELVGGQALDLAAEGRPVTPRAVREIHVRKTGGLIAAALEIGAIVAGAARPKRARFRRLGLDLGIAFQIHDDLLDRSSSLARMGKRARKDDAHRKATYPKAVGETRARGEAARLYIRCLHRIERMGIEAWDLGNLVLAVAEREG